MKIYRDDCRSSSHAERNVLTNFRNVEFMQVLYITLQ